MSETNLTLQENIKTLQREIADMLLFIQYANEGKIASIGKAEVLVWSVDKLTEIAKRILELEV